MKHRVYAFILTLSLVFIVTGCKIAEKSDETETDYVSLSTSESDTITETKEITEVEVTNSAPVITETQSATTSESLIDFSKQDNINLKPLELLGEYNVNEENQISLKLFIKDDCSVEEYRKYFFGTWEGWSWADGGKGELILDDSEKNNASMWLTGGFWKSNNTIAFMGFGNATVGIYWIDITKPDVMYCDEVFYSENDLMCFNYEKSTDYCVPTLKKTNRSINEPENGYISRLRLYEIQHNNKIDPNMLYNIDYILENEFYFSMNFQYSNPVFLISQTPNKLVLKSKLMFCYGFAYIDVIYTIELINGEWERIIEISPEAIESAKRQLKINGYIVN